MSKKILIVTEVFYPEDFVINDLVAEWIDNGVELEILTRIPSYPKGVKFPGFKNRILQKSIYKGAKVNYIPFIPGYQKSGLKKLLNYFNFMFLSFWFLIFKGRKFETIFIYQTGPLSNALSVTFLKRIFKWRIIIWSQDLWPETVYAYGLKETKITRLFLNGLVKFIYKRCDTILVSCRGFIPRIKKYAPAASFEWIPNWSLIEGESSTSIKLPGKFNFTFAGNIGKVQNLYMLVKAFSEVSKTNEYVHFNIVGDGSYFQELKEKVSSEKILNITFHGRQPVGLMPSYFASSDVLVLSLVASPIYEIMIPSKFQAYLNAGKPILSAISGELNDLVNDFNIGFTATSSDVNSIKQSFESFLAADQAKLNQFSVNSKELEKTYFDKQKTISRLTEILLKDATRS